MKVSIFIYKQKYYKLSLFLKSREIWKITKISTKRLQRW